jgi:hypothetical protein
MVVQIDDVLDVYEAKVGGDNDDTVMRNIQQAGESGRDGLTVDAVFVKAESACRSRVSLIDGPARSIRIDAAQVYGARFPKAYAIGSTIDTASSGTQ